MSTLSWVLLLLLALAAVYLFARSHGAREHEISAHDGKPSGMSAASGAQPDRESGQKHHGGCC